jgi:ribonuclease BN (tRNA processing enzyme)
MVELDFLGTGCGCPVPDRFYSSILLQSGESRFLLDAGEPCSHSLRKRKVSFDSLDAIFISHGHSDHVGGLPMLLQGAWLEPRTRPLAIYLPGELINPLQAWLDAVYLPAKLLGFPVQWRAWEDHPAVERDGLKLRIAPSSHLQGLGEKIEPGNPHGRFRAYSFALETGGKRIVYSADIGKPEDLDPHLEVPCDLLVCELAHFSPEALFTYLSTRPVRRLVLTHLSPRYEELGREGLEKLARGIPFELALDGTKLTV